MSFTAPRTWVAGETVTAAMLNEQIRDNIKSITDPWTAYTPAWLSTGTAPILGDGSAVGAYIQIGKTVNFWARIVAGPGSAYGSGTYAFTLPVPLAASAGLNLSGFVIDSSASGFYKAFADLAGTPGGSNIPIIVLNNGPMVSWTPTAPFTFATGDGFYISGTYQAA